MNKGKDPTREVLDCLTNSPYPHLRKSIENSTENIHIDVGREGLIDVSASGEM